MRALLTISAWFLAVLYLGLENLYDLSKAELAEKKRYNHSFHTFFYEYVVAKVNWRLMYTIAPNFEANVYISPKLQTWRLMCTLFPNLEAKVNFNFQLRSRLGLV